MFIRERMLKKNPMLYRALKVTKDKKRLLKKSDGHVNKLIFFFFSFFFQLLPLQVTTVDLPPISSVTLTLFISSFITSINLV